MRNAVDALRPCDGIQARRAADRSPAVIYRVALVVPLPESEIRRPFQVSVFASAGYESDMLLGLRTGFNIEFLSVPCQRVGRTRTCGSTNASYRHSRPVLRTQV